MTITLGIDIGTYETKAVLVEDGAVLAEAARGHQLRVPRPGWAEHDAEADWWADLCAVARETVAAAGIDPRQVAGLAVSAIGPCMLPVDAACRPLAPAVLYGVDTRAAAEIADLDAEIGAGRILEVCGNALTSQAVGPKILWLKRNRPEVYAAAARIHTATSFLVERLTGQAVIDHYTAANFAPLYDVGRLGWTDALAPGIVEAGRLPRPAWSAEIAGRITPAAAAATGLAAGTPVTTGTIDAAAEAVSVGVADPGELMLMYGSTVFAILITAARVRDPRLWYAPWLFPGAHASMAGLATSGTLTHWFRDRFAQELPRAEAFAALAAEAAASPRGARGLLCLPHFSGERTPLHDPRAAGAFFGLNLTHGRGDLYRALLEGIALATGRIVETWAEAGAPVGRVRAVGGGTRNPVWLQATSDVTGLEQELCAQTRGASYGDAFLAAVAVGAARPGDIARWNPVAARTLPERVPAYERARPLCRALYAQTRDIAHALAEPPA